MTGLEIAPESLRQALAVKADEWKIETQSASEFFDKIGSTVPSELRRRLTKMQSALDSQSGGASASG